ncbi:hypothetical protein EZ313_18015 [Ramlibacter henchirensis]|uniref:Lipopolysaccharide biosynthesis protein n=1 Tax=Ramlibacter henchirensis TaxID=204072 RepID=A0A4Z0BXU0_9BURK|nr:hypothetical protein [Ramlibacter henchirensis]TFZ03108.1 hypothetical protein EZ313_18015 [Ramlibacter henchirensis]
MQSLPQNNLGARVNSNHRAGVLLAADQALVSGGSFLTLVYLARDLTSTDFGVFTICWLVVLFAGTVFSSVITFPMMTTYPWLEKYARETYLIENMALFILIGAFTLLGFAVAAIGAFFFSGAGFGSVVAWTGVCAVAVQAHELVRRVSILRRDVKELLKIDTVSYAVRAAAFVAASVMAVRNVQVSLAIIAGSCLLSVFVVRFQGYPGGRLLKVGFAAWGRNKAMASTLLPSGLLQWGSMNFFMAAASVMLPAADVGRLRMCQALTNLASPIIQLCENVVPTRASEAITQGKAALSRYLLRVLGVGLAILAVPGIAATVYADSLIRRIYGVGFDEATTVVGLFVAAQLGIFAAMAIRAGLRAAGTAKHWLLANLVATIVSVISVLAIGLPTMKYVPALMVNAVIVLVFSSAIALYQSLKVKAWN